MSALARATWPAERSAEAMEALGVRAGLSPAPADVPPPPRGAAFDPRWIEAAAAAMGLEAEPLSAPYAELRRVALRSAPALLRIPAGSDGAPRVLALLEGGRRAVRALAPDGGVLRVAAEELAVALGREAEAAVRGDVERLARALPSDGGSARGALARHLAADVPVEVGALLRAGPSRGPREAAREARLGRLLVGLGAAHFVAHLLWVLAWVLLGRSALAGRLDPGWLAAWGLALLTLVPLRRVATRAGGALALRTGAALKARLLHGALRLDPDDVRHLETGALLGRVVESEVVDEAAVLGGTLAATALVELAVAAVVLGLGAGGAAHVALLAATCAAAVALTAAYARRRATWTDERLTRTGELVEKLAGHRTRLVQEPAGEWNRGEDRGLERLLERGRRMDRALVALQAGVPRGWLIAGLAGLAPGFVAGAGAVDARVAVGLGGVLLAFRALHDLSAGLVRLAAAGVAWRRVLPFFAAAARPERRPPPEPAHAAPRAAAGRTLLEARGLAFRYAGRAEPVLRGVDLSLRRGDRVLLEGASGSGKSTLARLIAGERDPDGGLLLLGGLDRATLGGEAWRRRVALVPQFHDNHVLLAPFGFNLLMGRRWPPTPDDVAEAEAVSRALGLGPLLERMPGGMQQMVGETGWQLSHGERSRLFLARALLQGADVVVLDESFAALDPPTLRRAMACARERAETLVVIAHP